MHDKSNPPGTHQVPPFDTAHFTGNWNLQHVKLHTDDEDIDTRTMSSVKPEQGNSAPHVALKLDDLLTPVTVSVDTTKISGAKVNPMWFGCHMDLGFAHPARGLYAQMLYGESFEFGHNSTWSYQPEHGGRTDPDAAALSGIIWNKNGSASFDMEYAHHGYVSLHAAKAGDGASNRGMGNEGLFLEANKPYEGRFYAHADDVTGGTVVVALRTRMQSTRRTRFWWLAWCTWRSAPPTMATQYYHSPPSNML